MAIVAKATGGGGTFEPAPAGVHSAVCVDVVDLGIVEATYEGKTTKKHKIRVVWQIGEDREDVRTDLGDIRSESRDGYLERVNGCLESHDFLLH